MRVLFIGGTGLISSACLAPTEAAGHELWLLNRGRSELSTGVPPERTIIADATDPGRLRAALRGRSFDVVVQWICFTPEHIEQDIVNFADVGQYVFISSASAYQKPPPGHWLITESTPLLNPHWEYSRLKIACEERLRAARAASGFPFTIVRPSHTYGPSHIPSMLSEPGYTLIDRIRRGSRIIVAGDGSSLWTVTHNTDFAKGFVGLLGHPGAIGEDFHITSDEALPWDRIYDLIGAAVGAEPDIMHVPTDALIAADPELTGGLVGDKSPTTVFDNSKVRGLVPGFRATVPFSEGVKECVAWLDADPGRQRIDAAANAFWDRVVEVYDDALARAAGASKAAG